MPYFDPESYPIAISESTSVNSTVIRVSAYDEDIDSNGLLTYRIVSGDSSGEYNNFKVFVCILRHVNFVAV